MLNLLIIDYYPDSIKHAFDRQARSNYKIDEATDAESGLEIARENIPDLILIDMTLAADTDFDVVRILKENPVTGSIPLLFVSDVSEKTAVLQARQLGAKGFVLKPISKEYLITKIKEINDAAMKDREKDKEKISGSVIYRKEEDIHFVYMLGKIEKEQITELYQNYLAHVSREDEKTFFAIDIRHLIFPNPDEMMLLKSALSSIKRHTPRIITGKNYIAAVMLELDLTAQMFMNRDDLGRYHDLWKQGTVT